MNRLISAIRRFLAPGRESAAGATAVGFALALPVLLLLSMAALEMALMIFEHNRATEATRAGLRTAVITGPVGDVSAIAGAPVTCTSSGSSLSCSNGGEDTASFNQIVAVMQNVMPQITAANVELRYEDSGVGLAEAGGIKPFVTLSVRNLTHSFYMIHAMLGTGSQVTLPEFSSTSMTIAPVP